MQTGIGAHADDDAIERYSMGVLPEAELERFEEHLLVCPECQCRVEETDHFVTAVRQVAPRLRVDKASSRWANWRQWIPIPAFPRLAMAGGLALLAIVFLIGRSSITGPGGTAVPATVLLNVTRGPEVAGAVIAPAGRPLWLETDTTELPLFNRYDMELVNSTGARLWFSGAQPAAGRLKALVPKTLRPGQYFVRLYSPSSELLREFSLRIH